ncbi:3-demethylubiquinone-9 3-O-methyltransferase [Ehrlichia chaffeensis str. Heartland]|uniref:bifunctional 2-polyprenyl-6-hydroxyphenol methylase/3-demethylubiquinol 3-O-methyltransferase UbiG n=1 Tax=Ehrlichia chaffeensis TaxID=945 RepID=UPI000444DC28|nr:bifunctional 2-polyprenyl-6-hydroxyphenol methylase/3-demethylubiquinol 3-O-methyltransferase UbiG [Ehrlichia chaffeensis]AHX03718.1 3-demethylubiquinone-9 3-O-methyltransferase [Ehrlichia chaffeensis str. Heartland]AHX06551.1 3-demethylubiquinone-9 3-O-methyltransferase [Ehrlichia chaffeensis str. Liberty]AHX08728.1 3-demethylubiquinone-9 3-O-methyltransferase [Ehrlichia chaffeensis str. Saint Vincent]AHX09336.1 3-demethylubiquinone-9 3-O-methyltransferase [Ehrlichia chaffeensis str. Wakull
MSQTVDQNELLKFSKIADKWWDEHGPLKALHDIHPLRMRYIVDYISKIIPKANFKSLSVLDLGCGGGLLSESMSRLGMKVLGIDASEESINIARVHASERGLCNLKYSCMDIESLVNTEEKYDIITIMEIIEHVDNLPVFVNAVSNALSDNGIIFLSTLNRTKKSFLYAIVCAEYILKLVPRKTHQWGRFVKPSEIVNLFSLNGICVKNIMGMNFNMIRRSWVLSDDISVNYILAAQKVSS